jgi:hypothetical protein
MKDECKEDLSLFFIGTDPRCGPDEVEGWFLKVKDAIASAPSTKKVLCIMDLAREVRGKCKEAPFTKDFIHKAFAEIRDLAKEKMQRLEEERELLHFSSARRVPSSLEVVEEEIRKEDQTRYRSWF